MAIENVSSRRIITTEDGKQYKKAGVGAGIAGYMAGSAAGGIVNAGITQIGKRPAIAAINGITSAEDFSKEVLDTFAKLNRTEKGLKFVDAAKPENAELVGEAVTKSLPKFVQKLCEKSPRIKKIIESFTNNITSTIKRGKNACYSPKLKAVVVNNEKLSIAAFHEMGHALNANTAGIGKILQKCRPLTLVSSAAMLIGLLKRKKVEGEKPKNLVDKVTTFVKDHCGAIAFAGFLPTVVEEGMASAKGYKLAKNVLSPENLKKLAKFQGKAWLTYAATAVGIGLATYLGSKVKDAIAKPKEIKQEAA